MRVKLKEILPSLSITILALIVCEIMISTIFPMLGMTSFRLPLNVLIVLYLGFKIESPYVAIMVLLVQVFHSFFSIESWALGTTAGVVVCMTIHYLREMIHLSSAVVTILITEIFQVLWFIIVSILIYIKNGNWSYVASQFWNFLPESLVLSILAPFLFFLLDKIWSMKDEGFLVG